MTLNMRVRQVVGGLPAFLFLFFSMKHDQTNKDFWSPPKKETTQVPDELLGYNESISSIQLQLLTSLAKKNKTTPEAAITEILGRFKPPGSLNKVEAAQVIHALAKLRP